MKKGEEVMQISVGIDISKDDFKACIAKRLADKQIKIIASSSFKNQAKGFEELWQWVGKHTEKFGLEVEFLMEATGEYPRKLSLVSP
jgi:transposase